MQSLYWLGAVLAATTGLVHSVLGERLIFRHLRSGGAVPTLAAPPLRQRHVRIIWATWHIASVFGWGFAGVLFQLGASPDSPSLRAVAVSAIAASYLGASLLVLVGTRGRHPGWIALALVGALSWSALYWQ